MATLNRLPNPRRTASELGRRGWACRLEAVTVTHPARELMLADWKAREGRARQALILGLAHMEHEHAEAVRRYQEFEEYLSAVQGRLRRAGYLAPT
jgi:hypothetical protein